MGGSAVYAVVAAGASSFVQHTFVPTHARLIAPRAAAANDALAEIRYLTRLKPSRRDLADLTHAIADAPSPLRRFRRYQLLTVLLRDDPGAYVDVAGWLHCALEVPRSEFPNLQNVPVAAPLPAAAGGDGLVPDCHLPDATFVDSPLDSFLLKFTRDRYAEHTPGPSYRSNRPGILGLLDEMRALTLDEAGTDDAQAALVHRILLDLMTPALPPVYRLAVAGFLPSEARGDPKWLSDLARYQGDQIEAEVECVRHAGKYPALRRAWRPHLRRAPLLRALRNVRCRTPGVRISRGPRPRHASERWRTRRACRRQVQVFAGEQLQRLVPSPVQAASGALV